MSPNRTFYKSAPGSVPEQAAAALELTARGMLPQHVTELTQIARRRANVMWEALHGVCPPPSLSERTPWHDRHVRIWASCLIESLTLFDGQPELLDVAAIIESYDRYRGIAEGLGETPIGINAYAESLQLAVAWGSEEPGSVL